MRPGGMKKSGKPPHSKAPCLSLSVSSYRSPSLTRIQRSALVRDSLNLLLGPCYDLRGERRVLHVASDLLAVVYGPPEKVYDRLALYRVLLLFVDEQVCVRRDRVSVSAWRVGDRHSQIVGHLFG